MDGQAGVGVDPQLIVAVDTSSALPKHNTHRKYRSKCTYELAKRQRKSEATESSVAATNADTIDRNFVFDATNPLL